MAALLALGSSSTATAPEWALTPGDQRPVTFNPLVELPLDDRLRNASAIRLSGSKPNVLFLVADDMRPQTHAYGLDFMKTPYLDALAKKGLIFDNAYSQFSFCAPSRASFMTGRRPDKTRVVNFLDNFRKYHVEFETMPQHFKNAGYFTSASGKLYHDVQIDEDTPSWTYPAFRQPWMCYKQSCPGDVCDANNNYCRVTKNSVPPYTDDDVILNQGLIRMDKAHQSGMPWFIGIGFHRPHHPWRLPEGFYGNELYPKVAPAKYPHAVKSTPFMSDFWEGMPGHSSQCPTCEVDQNSQLQFRSWYYAACTYVDALIGKALGKLGSFGTAVWDSTIILFMSDHGYHLGELNHWSKMQNTELATRTPLIIKVPWKTHSLGKRTRVNVELVDIYRTLSDLAGLSGNMNGDVQGESVAELFDNPAGASIATRRAYSQIGSCDCKVESWGSTCGGGRCIYTAIQDFEYMGYSMRTHDGWRFTAWVPMRGGRASWTDKVQYELYDLRGGSMTFDHPGQNTNLAGSAHVASLVRKYHSELEATVKTWY
jgi:arylsulfatase A-like enzyme